MNLGSCDLIVELRICGESKERIKITSDEGDGFMFHRGEPLKINKEQIKHDKIVYWAKQLEHKSLSLHELVENAKWLLENVR